MESTTSKNQLNLLIIVSIIIILWAVFNPFSPSMPKVDNINQIDAYTLIKAGKTLVLDVREKKAFDKGHLPNAISVPIGDLDKRIGEFEADKAKEIIVYCNDGSTRGPRGTKKLNDAGFARAKNLKGGVEGWKKAKYEVLK